MERQPSSKTVSSADSTPETYPKPVWVWRNIIFFVYLHIGAIYGLWLCFTDASWYTLLWTQFLTIASAFGITAGAHRLWSHKSYKARLPMRVILCICNTIAAQNSVIEWARDHRVHHKYSETNADPHNAKRGFFFSHIGWLLMRKHPDVKEKGSKIDISDLTSDPVLVFQHKYYIPLEIFLNYIFPALIPWYFWNESFITAFATASLLRYCYTLHATWSINSFAHKYGYRPYDKSINPRENILASFGAIGEGWHNYHHTFPHDYRTSEYSWRLNLTTILLDFFAMFGQVYDRKTVSQEAINAKMIRSGEGH